MTEPPLNLEHGFTVSVYFPPGSDPVWVSDFLSRVAEDAYGMPSDTLDAFVVGHAGDVLGIDGDDESEGQIDAAMAVGEPVELVDVPPGSPDGRHGYAGESERLPAGSCPDWCPCHRLRAQEGP